MSKFGPVYEHGLGEAVHLLVWTEIAVFTNVNDNLMIMDDHLLQMLTGVLSYFNICIIQEGVT